MRKSKEPKLEDCSDRTETDLSTTKEGAEQSTERVLCNEMGRKKGHHGQRKAATTRKQPELQILHPKCYLKSTVNVRQPVEFGSFSLNKERKYCDDNRNLRDYCPPEDKHFQFDLAAGYSKFHSKDEDVLEKLDTLLRWLHLHRSRFSPAGPTTESLGQESKRFNTDFISWRGLFTKILCAPYEKREPWQFAMVKFCGTIFICEVETAYKKLERQKRPPRLQQMCYWGFKFEDYVTKSTDPNGSVPDPEGGINNCESYCSVVRTRVSSHSVVIGAEVDCKDNNSSEKPPQNYIELKTTRHMDNNRLWESFIRYKLIKYWAQSFLAGVPTIICGLRDDDGIVDELRSFNTLDLPKMAKQIPGGWDPNVCLNFADCFLKFAKEVVVKEGPDQVYMFYFSEPFLKIEVKEKFGEGCGFLPDWFVSGATHNCSSADL